MPAVAGLCWLAPAALHAAPESLNERVLETARAYPDGGGYNDQWTGSGTPEQIELSGSTILEEGTGGTYCSGFTFTVAMRVAADAGLLDGKPVDAVRHFQREWYGAVSDETIREKQCAVAVETLGIGREVEMDEARPGDFVQFWRVRSGHSVVFLDWVYDDAGNKAGLRYRSSQGSTNGIGDRVEYFQESEAGDGHVDPERIYFARLLAE